MEQQFLINTVAAVTVVPWSITIGGRSGTGVYSRSQEFSSNHFVLQLS